MFEQRFSCSTLITCLLFSSASLLFGERVSVGFEEVQNQATEEGSVLKALDFPITAQEVERQTAEILERVEAMADAIAATSSEEVNFENTLGALDDLGFELWSNFGKVYLMKETSPDVSVREAGTTAVNQVQAWEVAFGYRKDIYDVMEAFAAKDAVDELKGEDLKLFEDVLREYRRKGFALPEEDRVELERLQTELSRLETDFRNNVRNADAKVLFTKAELEGLPEEFLAQDDLKAGEDEWLLDANVTFQYITLAENAKDPDVRERFFLARYNRAREENLPILQEVALKRQRVADLLGYHSWADYKTEVRMAESEERVRTFLDGLSAGLEENFKAERERLLDLKKRDVSGDGKVVLEDWDRSYYTNVLKKEVYDIDTEALRRYFPYESVLEGMFQIYERIFAIKIMPVTGVDVWDESVTTYVIKNSDDDRVLGLFYLDMFPREGKYNHFASFGVVDGKLLADGRYRRPVNVLVCNFPPPSEERPSLLSFGETETLFHEFGHLLHALLTRAKYATFSGTNVPRDFVEAPSQMLEFWLEDKDILDRFAADYEDPSQKLPADTLKRLIMAEKSTIASRYRGQIALGMMDLNIHTHFESSDDIDVLEITQDAWETYYAPLSADTAFAASFGHLMGYDAGYYGYIWSEAIAADMAAEFESAPDGFLDVETGRRLREEIYEVGGSRDINVSIERFLGRPVSQEPFFESVGLGAAEE